MRNDDRISLYQSGYFGEWVAGCALVFVEQLDLGDSVRTDCRRVRGGDQAHRA